MTAQGFYLHLPHDVLEHDGLSAPFLGDESPIVLPPIKCSFMCQEPLLMS